MPIAHCLISEKLDRIPPASGVVAAWASGSEVSPEHLSLSFARPADFGGATYAVMATLYLPSSWRRTDLERIELALASALAQQCRLDPGEVHVITVIVQSGAVVEAGAVQRWKTAGT